MMEWSPQAGCPTSDRNYGLHKQMPLVDKSFITEYATVLPHIALFELLATGMGVLGTDFSSRLLLHMDSFLPFTDICQ